MPRKFLRNTANEQGNLEDNCSIPPEKASVGEALYKLIQIFSEIDLEEDED